MRIGAQLQDVAKPAALGRLVDDPSAGKLAVTNVGNCFEDEHHYRQSDGGESQILL